MRTFTYENIRVAGMATAVPDELQELMEITALPHDELERFCENTGIHRRYKGFKHHQTASDLCYAAAERLIAEKAIPREEIGAMVLLTQTPDYMIPPTSCVLQHRMGLTNCDLVYDSNLGCASFPFGLQMICAALSPKLKYGLILIGESTAYPRKRQPDEPVNKDSLLFGDAGCAILLEWSEGAPAIHIGLQTIGSGYRDLIAPFGQRRHPLRPLLDEYGEKALQLNNMTYMDGENVFTFSVISAPKIMKKFMAEFDATPDNIDFLGIHQANTMIINNVLKRLKISPEKIEYSLRDYGNTRGVSCVLSTCQHYGGNSSDEPRRVDFLAFGIGLNISMADLMLTPSACLPIFTTRETYDDGLKAEDYLKTEE